MCFCRAYWISFVPLRLILYPVLLVRFWVVLEPFPLWERLLVCTCQLFLCFFNVGAPTLILARNSVGLCWALWLHDTRPFLR